MENNFRVLSFSCFLIYLPECHPSGTYLILLYFFVYKASLIINSKCRAKDCFLLFGSPCLVPVNNKRLNNETKRFLIGYFLKNPKKKSFNISKPESKLYCKVL